MYLNGYFKTYPVVRCIALTRALTCARTYVRSFSNCSAHSHEHWSPEAAAELPVDFNALFHTLKDLGFALYVFHAFKEILKKKYMYFSFMNMVEYG